MEHKGELAGQTVDRKTGRERSFRMSIRAARGGPLHGQMVQRTTRILQVYTERCATAEGV